MNETTEAPTATSIDEYLQQLAEALAGEDPALIQDALHDAEEHLRDELASQPDVPEAEVLAKIASSYGNPDEVAEEYRRVEDTVRDALSLEPRRKADEKTGGDGFFSVLKDARAYGALFYMLLSLATGIVYFTITVTGFSLSLGLSVLIIGFLVLLLFLTIERSLSLVEGRMVETLLGVRMPRRKRYQQANRGLIDKLKEFVTDTQTWTTMLYMVMMLPLGVAYFCLALVGVIVSLALLLSPIAALVAAVGPWPTTGDTLGLWAAPLTFLAGVFLLPATLHLAKFVGRFHGSLAKSLLVQAPG